ncbi:Uncharacterized membrane protein, DUF3592 family [Halapricum desulfuricans]|uniref:Uncharacterized membrane protein, DUF3592 family n=2 Tax=Halapricum desulfuricans TaxID=2841257 RepID=A0A897NG86_9EURY|nr:Uncharacterized membrane protein, DUF3592 family [Halapricum desulfuricans]
MLVALLLGVGIAGYGGYDYVQQADAVDDAVAVNTTITDAEISEISDRSTTYRVTVEHTYRFQGTEYTSRQVFPGRISPMYVLQSDAAAVIEQYEPNATATAYVDPDAPSQAFLERRTVRMPFVYVGFGGLLALLTTLHAIGARNPGQDTELRLGHEQGSTRDETLLGFDLGTINSLSKYLMLGSPVVLALSLVGTVYLTYRAESSVQAEITDPIGITAVGAFVAALGLIAGLALYTVWSFSEYRRLRERIPQPRPPSPFRHPSRLVTILYRRSRPSASGSYGNLRFP